MSQQKRFAAIRDIITNSDIHSQEELLRQLEGRGIKCTQATLSRNLRQMKVVRVPAGEGKMAYRPGELNSVTQENFDQGLGNGMLISRTWATGLLLLKTHPGFAPALASAIDRSGVKEIAGTIAGDDTVLVIPLDNQPGEKIDKIIDKLFPA